MTAPPVRRRLAPRWKAVPAPDPRLVDRLTSELHLPPLVSRLLVTRGYGDLEEARRYLRPRLEHLHDASLMLGMDRAVDRLARAIQRGEKILVHGDYDVDGICSSTIMVKVLRHLGGVAEPFVPHRMTDGYDLGDAGVDAAIRQGATLVLTCDCGTSAHTAIARLASAGIDVIVSDHHLPSRPVPECVAVLNPRQPGCEYPDKDLCAAGVAFKLSLALLRKLGGSDNVALRLLDLVALATIADVAPLRGENRALARYGLKMMSDTNHVGLRALIEAAGLAGSPLTAGKIGFVLAPRLNAAGRVGHAMRGVELLLSSDVTECNRLARDLEELNKARQDIDRETLAQARAMTDRLDLDQVYGVVLGAEGWHPGVIGIVASRLVEDIARPVMLVALEQGMGKGSGRSPSRFDLHAGLTACSDLLVRYGGHRAAAGITIAADRLDAFAERFNQVARERLTPDDLYHELRIDLELSADDITADLEALLRYFEPYGMGNPAPTLAIRGARLHGPPRTVGKDGQGLKLRLASGHGPIDALGWGMADRIGEFASGAAVDVAFRLERDSYMGETRIVTRISDVRG
ncbi:MAG: single-stranded-DNA-specific exonuclease RecJ [Gemmatimonadaceae bacterium]|nr:single-stranded-DNA-specific exonuclease RecJ [Gemmatimonadaceae bacterium]